MTIIEHGFSNNGVSSDEFDDEQFGGQTESAAPVEETAGARRRQRAAEITARLDQVLVAAQHGGVDFGEVHELGARLQEAHEDTLAALERVVVRTRFRTAAEADDFLQTCRRGDAAQLIEEEVRLLGAIARWRLLCGHGHATTGDLRARLVALSADRLRVQSELARDLFRDLELWRPTPYWTLRNVAGGNYPNAFRGWSAATRAAYHLREQAGEAVRELQLR